MTRRPPQGHRAAWKWAAGVLVLAALVAAGALLPVREGAEALRRWVDGLGAWGPVVYAAAYALATLLAVPASPLTLVAGLAFGVGRAFALVVVAATVGATLAFLVSRYALHDRVAALVAGRPKLKAVNEAVSESGWKVVALLRLSPVVPFNLQNYFYGITDIRLGPYVAATFFGIMPGTLLYVYLGAAGHALAAGGIGRWQWLFLACGLAATVAGVVLVGRRARARLRRLGVNAGEDGH